jgi:hypothetical protein
MSAIQHTPTPEAYKYDFDGACAPHSNPHSHYDTFTLGIFQWRPKSQFAGRPANRLRPDQLKRGPVDERIKGYSGNEEAAYEEARRRVAELNTAQQAAA